MPTLDWIGKKAVVKHHKEVPYRLLEPVAELSHGDADSGNLIVQGDNLHALKALLPRYAGKVKCIYIDPPYNTGNEGWVYNDNVNSPEINKWLGEVVGKEADDLSRHDKWLCMMYPRLLLLREFLREDGLLLVSIGDDEVGSLELIGREIFGRQNFVAKLIWNTEGNTDNQLEIKTNHEYILIFVKNKKYKSSAIGHVIDPNTREDSNLWKGVADNNINKNNKANPPGIFTIPVGFPSSERELHYSAKMVDDIFFSTAEMEQLISEKSKEKYGIESKSGLPVKLDDLIIKDYKVTKPCRVFGGFANRRKLEKFVSNDMQPIEDDGGELSFYINRNSGIRYRKANKTPRNILSVLRNMGTTEKMKTELKDMGILFDYPKPVDLIKYLLSFSAQSKEAVIMDSFAGSGTAAHSVLRLNKVDGGNRKFIMVEMDANIASSVTAERIRRVASGYTTAKGKTIAGLGSGFQFCKLSDQPLFNADGQIRSDVTFSQLAEFVWFAETGSGFTGSVDSPLLGIYEGRAIYLLYNGILKDRSINGGNVLTTPVLDVLPVFDGSKVIYAAACRLGNARLNKLGIQFKQTPYALEV